MINTVFRSVDLFCGAGGLSLGLSKAGFSPVFALDSDENACATYRLNLGDVVHHASADSICVDDICRSAGVSLGEISLVSGGPPCQGFSVQRRGGANDSRNRLVNRFVELAIGLRPPLILMENVPTLLGPRGRSYLDEVDRALAIAGYRKRSTVLNAAAFGVPQVRSRAFIVAWDASRLKDFSFPVGDRKRGTFKTVRDAIGDLPSPPADFSEHPQFWNHTRVRISALNVERISHVPPGGGRKDIPAGLQLPCHRNDNGHRHLDVFGRMIWDSPSPTITAMFDNFTRGRFAHPSEDRSITGREGARLQTFPDRFRFLGDKKSVARQVGNGVPPLLACELGGALMNALLGREVRRGGTLQAELL